MYVVEMYRKSGIKKKCEEKRCEKMENQGRGKRKKRKKIYRTKKTKKNVEPKVKVKMVNGNYGVEGKKRCRAT